MTVYLIMLAISLFFASCAGRLRGMQEYRRNFRVCAVLSFLPFFIVSAIRFEVGTDWSIYDRYFYAINEGTDQFKEWIFNLLNKAVYVFSNDSQLFFAVTAALSLIFVFLAIYKHSVYIPFSILLFFVSTIYFNSMNQMRQGLAMGIFLFAFRYIEKRDWKKYFLWILIGAGIHLSALLFLPLYFIYGWKAELKKHLILFGAILVFMPVLKVVLIKIVSLTPYAWYFESLFKQNDFLLAGFLISFLILVLHEYYNNVSDSEEDTSYSFMVNMQWLSTVVLLCTGFIPQVSRISSAFEVISLLSVPKMVLREKNRNRRIVVYCIVTLLFVVRLIYYVYICGFFHVIPYKTFFSR